MRISLVHGADTSVAYKKFRELVDGSKKKGFEIVNIKSLQEVRAQFLFEDKIVFVLDKPKNIKPNDWKWLKTNADKVNSNLLIFIDGLAGVTITRSLPKDARIEKFELPKIIFIFLDAIYPGNVKKVLNLFNDLLKTQPTELILFMLARHIRDIYWAQIDAASMSGPDWKNIKFKKQADKFEDGKLEKLITDLAQADVKAKTGEGELKSLLEIIFIKDLE